MRNSRTDSLNRSLNHSPLAHWGNGRGREWKGEVTYACISPSGVRPLDAAGSLVLASDACEEIR